MNKNFDGDVEKAKAKKKSWLTFPLDYFSLSNNVVVVVFIIQFNSFTLIEKHTGFFSLFIRHS